MSDYSFQIRDNYDPIQLVWEDVIADGTICGDMPVVRANYQDEQIEFAAYLTRIDQLDLLTLAERNMKWANAFTST